MQDEYLLELQKDHQQVNGILGALRESRESLLLKRAELFQKLAEELVPHMKAEGEPFPDPLLAKKEAPEETAHPGSAVFLSLTS